MDGVCDAPRAPGEHCTLQARWVTKDGRYEFCHAHRGLAQRYCGPGELIPKTEWERQQCSK